MVRVDESLHHGNIDESFGLFVALQNSDFQLPRQMCQIRDDQVNFLSHI